MGLSPQEALENRDDPASSGLRADRAFLARVHPDDAGVLVDPLDEASIADGLRRAAELPRPNQAARAAAALHDVTLQAARIEEILARAVRGA